MPDLARAYQEARTSMAGIAGDLDPEAQQTRVPACPDWTVKDLIAHVTSIASDLTAGRGPKDLNLIALWDPEVARRREEWIEGSMAARRDRSTKEILAEWDEAGPRLEAILRGEQPAPPGAPPLIEWIVTTDVGVHQHDLRGAVGLPGDRDSLATGLSLRSYVEGMRFQSPQKGLPPFRIRAGSREWVVGEGEPVATVTADPFELARAASGRRSPDQIRAYDWDGDPEPFLDLFYPYGGPRTEALVE